MGTPRIPVEYGKYLRLETLLSLQEPRSAEEGRPAHDEILFIIVHQTYELWFKQILHELDSVLDVFGSESVDERRVGIAVARLTRIGEIFKLLIDQLRVLETMTPLDFLDFRDLLAPASGFDSYQFRMLEYKLGLPGERRIPVDKLPHVPTADRERLERAADGPSLFTLTEGWLERTPFIDTGDYHFWASYRTAVEAMLAHDRQTIESSPRLTEDARRMELKELERTEMNFRALFDTAVHDDLVERGLRRLSHKATLAALFIQLYRDQPILHLPFRFLEQLVDIDELLATWRYRHALMAQRMIGTKIGTGGSSGHQYLKSTVDHNRIFSDLFNLSTFLIPRSALPDLGPELQRRLGFAYS